MVHLSTATDSSVGLGVPLLHGRASKYWGDNAEGHVLVYAGEAYRFHLDPGLLFDLWGHAVFDGLVEFEHTAG